ncbi:MAG: amidohydrolase family protein, partial [Gemmatimonadota bacterium]
CPPENQVAQADVDVGSAAVQESIRRIVDAGAAVISTLAVYETFVPGRARLDPRSLEMLAPAVRERVERAHAELARGPFTVPERLLRRMMEWERDFVAAGGVLASGSDPWGTGLLPGYGNARNYELFIEAGFAPEVAVRILTLNGARVMGIDDWTGTIETGKVADLVVIRGDPMSEPQWIYDTELVFLAGLGYDAGLLRERVSGRLGGS